MRELAEETHLAGTLTHIVGIYTRPQAIRFVFGAAVEADPRPGDEILDVRFETLENLRQMRDDQLVAPSVLRAAARDAFEGERFPLSLVK